jgi:hypothetical protein
MSVTGIEVSEQYDKEGDVYYVTLKTGEPSIAVEHDDVLVMEMGIFTKLPTGFRILNYTRHKSATKVYLRIFIKMCKELGLRKIKHTEQWKRQIGRKFSKVLEVA